MSSYQSSAQRTCVSAASNRPATQRAAPMAARVRGDESSPLAFVLRGAIARLLARCKRELGTPLPNHDQCPCSPRAPRVMSPRVAKTLRGTALAVYRSAATPRRSLALAQPPRLSARTPDRPLAPNAPVQRRRHRRRPSRRWPRIEVPALAAPAFIRPVHPAATIHSAAPRRQRTALTPSRARSQARHAISRTEPLLDELFGLAA